MNLIILESIANSVIVIFNILLGSICAHSSFVCIHIKNKQFLINIERKNENELQTEKRSRTMSRLYRAASECVCVYIHVYKFSIIKIRLKSIDKFSAVVFASYIRIHTPRKYKSNSFVACNSYTNVNLNHVLHASHGHKQEN